MANIINGTDTGSGGLITTGDSSDELQLQTAETTALTIDSSQNVGVGTTTPGARIEATASGAAVQILNRTTSDGTILQLEKDGSTIGSIASVSASYVGIGSSDTGIYFESDVDAIIPLNVSTQSNRDAAIDLGYSTVRYKDLYLSGSVYLGGTTSANALDDYEEGTFTPTVVGVSTTGTASYAIQVGRYTKIGNRVLFELELAYSGGTGSGFLRVVGLPFVSSSASSPFLAVGIGDITLTANNTGFAYVIGASTSVAMRQTPVGGGSSTSISYDAAGEISIAGHYAV